MDDSKDQVDRIGRAAAKFRNIVQRQLETAEADLGGMGQIEARIEEAEECARQALVSSRGKGDDA